MNFFSFIGKFKTHGYSCQGQRLVEKLLLPVDATVDGEDSAWAERAESECGDDDEYGGVK